MKIVRKKLKILIIRLSSIGDIILTTPIIRCLKQQTDADIDFLTKNNYKNLLNSNPNITQTFGLSENKKELLNILKSKKYDCVIDLQNNLRSFKIRFAIGVKSYVYSKNNFKRYLLIQFGYNLLNNHVVDRYFKTVKKLRITNDKRGVDYFMSDNTSIEFDTNQNYLIWCIGGTHEAKKLSFVQISDVLSHLNLPVILIGGSEDMELSEQIIQSTHSKIVYNFCGKTSIEESAYLLKKSQLVLTNDTGMMHIASAFDSPIISFWGCTKPSLGFYPYLPKKEGRKIITSVTKKPCSKHGKYCRTNNQGCIKEINSLKIYNTIKELLK